MQGSQAYSVPHAVNVTQCTIFHDLQVLCCMAYYGGTTWCVLAVAVVSSCATVGHSIGQSKAYFKALRQHDS